MSLKPPDAVTDELADFTSPDMEFVLRANGITDVTRVQAAVNAYAGERKIILDGSFFAAASEPSITLPDNTWIEARPGTTFTKGATSSLPIFTAYGSVATAVNLSGNAARGARTLNVPTGTFVAGDWLLLKSSALWTSFEAGALQGELVHVKEITDATNLTVYSPLNDDYTTADTARVEKVTFRRNVTFKDVKWICDTPNTGNGGLLHSRYSWDLHIEDTSATDYCGIVHYLETGIGTTVNGGDFYNGAISPGFGYGIDLAGAQQGAVVNHITGHNGRNLVTTNGSSRGGVPRDCVISDSTVSGEWAIGGFHTHYVGERITFDGCGGTGVFTSGLFHLAGKNCTVSDGLGGDINGNGVYIEPSAVSCTIKDTVIRRVSGASCRAILDTGVDTRILGGFYESVTDASELVYTEGDGMLIKGTVLKPGVTKHGMTTWDNTDTWFAIDVTVIDANIAINYGTVGGVVTPTPRVAGLKTFNVTTVISSAIGIVSRDTLGTGANTTVAALRAGPSTGGAGENYIEYFEQSADPAAPAANGVRVFAKDNGAGKTQLMARFATGANQQLAIQP